jgi:hypothetical protein
VDHQNCGDPTEDRFQIDQFEGEFNAFSLAVFFFITWQIWLRSKVNLPSFFGIYGNDRLFFSRRLTNKYIASVLNINSLILTLILPKNGPENFSQIFFIWETSCALKFERKRQLCSEPSRKNSVGGLSDAGNPRVGSQLGEIPIRPSLQFGRGR